MSPKEVIVNESIRRVSHLVLARTEQDEDTGEWKIDEDETLKKVFNSEIAKKIVRFTTYHIYSIFSKII